MYTHGCRETDIKRAFDCSYRVLDDNFNDAELNTAATLISASFGFDKFLALSCTYSLTVVQGDRNII